MKKFEEEVKRPINAGIDPFSKRDVSFEKLSNKFTKGAQTLKEWKEYAFRAEDRIRELESQLDSQQPEIPEFVSELIVERGVPEDGVFNNYVLGRNEHDIALEWINNHQRTWLLALLNGYTVAKEKRFYLKHIDFCKRHKDYDWYMIKHSDGPLNHLRVEKGTLPPTVDTYFTQQEIDSMETGSYEQIEVEE